MGMSEGSLSVKASINLYQALVRSVLEYSCEIWGDQVWLEGEKVQREMGRRILRCNGKTTNEAVTERVQETREAKRLVEIDGQCLSALNRITLICDCRSSALARRSHRRV